MTAVPPLGLTHTALVTLLMGQGHTSPPAPPYTHLQLPLLPLKPLLSLSSFSSSVYLTTSLALEFSRPLEDPSSDIFSFRSLVSSSWRPLTNPPPYHPFLVSSPLSKASLSASRIISVSRFPRPLVTSVSLEEMEGGQCLPYGAGRSTLFC